MAKTKLQFAVDHEYKGEKVEAGKIHWVEPLDARDLIHYGIARVAPETQASKAAEKKGA
jgi:hypothetical protein